MNDLKSQFEATTAKLIEARRALFVVREATIAAKEALKDCETGYILQGLQGKNEKERDAYLRQGTINYRTLHADAEKAERAATLELEILRDCRRQLENIALIESGEA